MPCSPARRAGLAAVLLLLAACSPGAEPPTAPPPPKIPAPHMPAPPPAAAAEAMSLKFEGVLVCADCPGIKTELTLTRKAEGWAEGSYRLVETYLERGAPFVSSGEWTTLRGDAKDPDTTVYQLNPDKPKSARHFLRVGQDEAIKALDGDLKPLPESLPSTLTRVK